MRRRRVRSKNQKEKSSRKPSNDTRINGSGRTLNAGDSYRDYRCRRPRNRHRIVFPREPFGNAGRDSWPHWPVPVARPPDDNTTERPITGRDAVRVFVTRVPRSYCRSSSSSSSSSCPKRFATSPFLFRLTDTACSGPADPAAEMSRKEALTQFIQQIHGRPVVVKLNSGVDYRGKRRAHVSPSFADRVCVIR